MRGYYRKPQATAEIIVDGWLRTGDIGRLDADGCLHITDRKKDLIKTAGGKFVAPQKLETRFVTDPYISQAFVYGDRQSHCVALIVPKADQLQRWAREQGIAGGSLAELARDPKVQAFYWSRVQAHQQDLAPFEQVKRIALLEQEFSQSAGELTPTLKAKRGAIATRYAPVLERLYQARAS
jgi:long-chain acyl-CoA synthetase